MQEPNTASNHPKARFRTVLDLGTVVLFFLCFKFFGVFVATAVLMSLSLLTTVYLYMAEKEIPWVSIVTTCFILSLGAMTLFFHDETFIKLKLTFINGFLALILFFGYISGHGLLKYMLGNSIHMSDMAWRIFSLRWAILFSVLAGLNEVIWRSFSTEIWVNYKVFGVLGLTFLFMITQYPFLKRHSKDKE